MLGYQSKPSIYATAIGIIVAGGLGLLWLGMKGQ